MANDTINEIFYNHLKSNVALNAAVDDILYILNESSVKNNYAVTYLSGDPKDREMLCPTDEGQAVFSCIVFHTEVPTGINHRQIFQDAVKTLESTTTGEYTVSYINIINVVDSPTGVNDLFEFSFEAVVSWERYT